MSTDFAPRRGLLERLRVSLDAVRVVAEPQRGRMRGAPSREGVEDLARLIGAAELQAASHRTGPLTAGDIMSRDLITVRPDTRLREVARIFRQHGFTSLPVVDDGDVFRGVIFQIHLIRRAHQDAFRHDHRLIAAMARLLFDTNICREVGRGRVKPEEAGRPSKIRA